MHLFHLFLCGTNIPGRLSLLGWSPLLFMFASFPHMSGLLETLCLDVRFSSKVVDVFRSRHLGPDQAVGASRLRFRRRDIPRFIIWSRYQLRPRNYPPTTCVLHTSPARNLAAGGNKASTMKLSSRHPSISGIQPLLNKNSCRRPEGSHTTGNLGSENRRPGCSFRQDALSPELVLTYQRYLAVG